MANIWSYTYAWLTGKSFPESPKPGFAVLRQKLNSKRTKLTEKKKKKIQYLKRKKGKKKKKREGGKKEVPQSPLRHWRGLPNEITSHTNFRKKDH